MMTTYDTAARCPSTMSGKDSTTTIRFIDYKNESQLEDVMRLVALDLSEPYSIFTYRYFLHRFPDLCILAVDDESGEVCGCVVGKIDLEHPPNSNNSNGEGEGDSTGSLAAAHSLDEEDVLETNRGGTTDGGGENSNLGAHNPTTTMDTADPTTTVPDESSNADASRQQNQNQQGQPQEQPQPKLQPQQTGYIGMLAVSESYRRRGIGKDLVRRVLLRMKDRGCTSATLETEVSNVTAQTLYQNCFGFVREELLVRYYLNWGDAYRLRLWF
jgi:ribosomal protein S18 acetylase RimI-like enzyme